MRQLLSHARGSLYEVEAELIAAWRLGYIDEATLRAKRQQAQKVGRPLARLIRWVKKRETTKSR
jgi:four helix bundle protein